MTDTRPPEPDRHFGTDFVAFLLIIYGGMLMLAGFFWLLSVIIEAVR